MNCHFIRSLARAMVAADDVVAVLHLVAAEASRDATRLSRHAWQRLRAGVGGEDAVAHIVTVVRAWWLATRVSAAARHAVVLRPEGLPAALRAAAAMAHEHHAALVGVPLRAAVCVAVLGELPQRADTETALSELLSADKAVRHRARARLWYDTRFWRERACCQYERPGFRCLRADPERAVTPPFAVVAVALTLALALMTCLIASVVVLSNRV